MGLLVDGIWKDQWYDTKATGGHFKRSVAQLRNWITSDGSAGPSGKDGFKAEKGRYHLYVSYACPWAHRTLIFLKLKGLEDYITVSVVDPIMLENGWEFRPSAERVEGSTDDDLFGFSKLWQVYTKTEPAYTGRVTVPVLWDKLTGQIVSNESSEIIRMFNTAFNHLTGNRLDFNPEELRAEIDTLNDRIYSAVNNGVYKAGFATSQEAYAESVTTLFDTLDALESKLATQRYLLGETQTEADWRLFTTLIRFDAVYVGHFKCNIRRIDDYPNLSAYMRDLYQNDGIASTVNMLHIKDHYYRSHLNINPTGIVPAGPLLDFNRPHNRDKM